MNLRRNDKYVALSSLSMYSTWKKVDMSCKNNKFQLQTWIDKFELPDGLYFVSNIRDYFYYINKKHKTVPDNLLIRLYVNLIENRVTSEIKTGY